MPLFEKPTGGYRRLDSFALATLIQLETWRFCHRFIPVRDDPKGRLLDQMTQAARSGRANLIEGAERATTSRETEMKLTDVARASLAELLGDYEMWLLFHNQKPWTAAEAGPVYTTCLDPPPEFGVDVFHNSCGHYLAQRQKFAAWLDSADSCTVANALIVLIHRSMHMIRKQLEALGREFLEKGGFREELTTSRLEVRDGPPPADAPVCPLCGKAMRQRTARATGKPFWSCSGWPACKGARSV